MQILSSFTQLFREHSQKAVATVAAIAAFSFATPARAEVLTFSFGSLEDFMTTELDTTGILGLFDSNLGTLTGAMLVFEDVFRSDVSISNSSAQAQTAIFSSFIRSTRGSSITAIDNLIKTPVNNEIFDTGSFSLAVGESRDFGPYEATQTYSFDLADYLSEVQAVGGGDFSVNLKTRTSTTMTGGGNNLDFMQRTSGAVSGYIKYTYTAVPEPSSMLMAGGALMGLLLRRRRPGATV